MRRNDMSSRRTADVIRAMLWVVATIFAIAGVVCAYIGIINQHNPTGDVFGGLAGLNLGLAALLVIGNGFSYI